MPGVRERCVVLFSKPSLPGRVKTRLVGDLSAAEAAQLHAAFLADLLAGLSTERFGLRVAWALESGDSVPATSLPLIQHGADLGERQWNALCEAATDARAVAAIGSDVPDLPAGRLDEAFAALEGGFDVALGPAVDGGYYLIALRAEALREELFLQRSWSTESVYVETLACCARAGLRVHTLPTERDVDTPADLEALAGRLARAPGRCPSTRALLQSWRLLPLEVEA